MGNIKETKREILVSPKDLEPLSIQEVEEVARDLHEKLSGRVRGVMMVVISEDGKGIQALEGEPIVLLDMANLAMKEAVKNAPMSVMAEFIGGLAAPGANPFQDMGDLDLSKPEKPTKPENVI